MTPVFKGISYPGYEITEEGVVISHKAAPRPLKPTPNRKGYLEVSLSNSGAIKNMCVHRVMAHTFLGTEYQEKGEQIHHIDGDKTNNRLSNLTPVTAKENILAFVKTGKHHLQKLTPADVRDIRLRYAYGESVDSIRYEYQQISSIQIYRIAKGQRSAWVEDSSTFTLEI